VRSKISKIVVVAMLAVPLLALATANADANKQKAKGRTFNSALGPSQTRSASLHGWTFSTTADAAGNCQETTIVHNRDSYYGASEFTGPFSQTKGIPSVFAGPNASSHGSATTLFGSGNVAAIISTNDNGGSFKCWTSGLIYFL
jgi:hypothetical protein